MNILECLASTLYAWCWTCISRGVRRTVAGAGLRARGVPLVASTPAFGGPARYCGQLLTSLKLAVFIVYATGLVIMRVSAVILSFVEHRMVCLQRRHLMRWHFPGFARASLPAIRLLHSCCFASDTEAGTLSCWYSYAGGALRGCGSMPGGYAASPRHFPSLPHSSTQPMHRQWRLYPSCEFCLLTLIGSSDDSLGGISTRPWKRVQCLACWWPLVPPASPVAKHAASMSAHHVIRWTIPRFLRAACAFRRDVTTTASWLSLFLPHLSKWRCCACRGTRVPVLLRTRA